jgi:hypothetical protein
MKRTLVIAAGSVLLSNGLLPGMAVTAPDAATAAAPYRVKDLQVLSGQSPFAAGCPGALGDGDRINPANPRNIVGTWQQDLGLAARTDLVASSLDGGRTWTRATIPGLTRCTGGTADAASDPWVSAGGDAAVYFVGAPGFLTADPPLVGFVASRSGDGGRSWTPATTVASPDPRNDKETITASPTLAGHAYVVWANRDTLFNFPMTNLLEFARTTDGGSTWSDPVVIDRPGPTAADISSEVLVLPDGTLLTIFSRVDVDLADFSVQGEIHAARSRDEGRTWLPAVRVASQPIQPIFDPETGEQLPNQDLIIHSAAVAPDGSVDIAWDDDSSATTGQLDVARSRDGGLTWTVTALAGVRAFVFEPSVAVDSHGTIGLTWYDLRNDRRLVRALR